jgi:hypothetical protein
VSSFVLCSCEDGPAQTFTPLAPGGQDLINNGGPDASWADPVKGSYDSGFQGHSAQEICGAELKRARWAKMLTDPIEPPRHYAGLDLANDDGWGGLTIEDAERAPDPISLEGGNCQPNVLGYVAGDTGKDVSAYWGDNQEVVFDYHVDTHIVDQMYLNIGYLGAMTCKSRPDPNKNGGRPYTYVAKVGEQWTKDAGDGSGPQKFPIDWQSGKAVYQPEITELYNACMLTFGSGAGITTFQDSKGCADDGACLVAADDGAGNNIFGFRPLAIYFVAHIGQPQPLLSTEYSFYNFFIKNEPYGNAYQTLKLDAEGAIADGSTVSPPLPNCRIKVGLSWKDFLSNCVEVSSDPAANTLNLNRLLGGRTHDFESFSFNVVGVNQNFTVSSITNQGSDHSHPPASWFQVVNDADKPAPDDIATDFIFDVRAKGKPTNDLDGNGDLDLHGTGLVLREWQRLMLADVSTYIPSYSHVPGDPACVGLDAAGMPTGVPYGTNASDCTGLEALVIPGLPYPGDPPGITGMLDSAGFYYSSLLKPGDPYNAFAWDPGSAYLTTVNYAGGGQGYFWDNALQTVIQVLGKGDVFHIPSEMRDRRYYFRWWAIALVKYYKAYGKAYAAGGKAAADAITPADVANQLYDYDSLFFDNQGGAQFDTAEYIEREFIGTSARHVPFDWTYGTDVRVANQRYTNWYQRMDREETVMYEALATNKALPPGSENNVVLTNMFGSPILAANWESYTCATTGTPHSCPNSKPVPPPRTHLGTTKTEPLFQLYPGAWGPNIFHQGSTFTCSTSKTVCKQDTDCATAGEKCLPTGIKIDEELPYFGAVKAELPSFANPYDLTSASTPLPVLVPWVPRIPGEGFTIPVSPTRDKLIETATLDFTGVLENYLVDYDYDRDAKGNTLPTIRIKAIEAPDFLGEVFLCYYGGDLLHVGMYTSAAYIVDWLANHPGAADACDIVLRYSPFGNYLDYITSRTNGVKVSINQGTGLGRVVDALLYDPTLANDN